MAKEQSARKAPVNYGDALVQSFETNERINEILIDLLDPGIWRTFPASSKRRNIATSFAHIHNGRCMRIRMSARGSKLPARLDRAEVTPDQAKKALAASAQAMTRLIRVSVEAGGWVAGYSPDIASFVCSAINPEAHHRGQICHWARELGSPLSPEQQLMLWEWPRLWKEVASASK